MLLSAAAIELIAHARGLYMKMSTRLEAINTLRQLVDQLQIRVGIAHKAVLPVAFELATMMQAHGAYDKAIVQEVEVLFAKLFDELEVRRGIQHPDCIQTALTLGKIKHQRKSIHGIARAPEAQEWAATFIKRLGSALRPESALVIGTTEAFQELIGFKPVKVVATADPLEGMDPALLAYLTDGKTGGEDEGGIWALEDDDGESR
jgi:hypothetical protein